ncbi:UPF0691 protein C9orf116-like isoform X1 [Pomacea canaliculata]|uniref:UPF0691 protein C9orf116-like isoform X1 n=1 Tax=Pomacea canaliculata TaxID=400727 RepID=UPI000D739683|nr:UPF0691 protein C9orf116-like isoform X1 [Pomacea canaliculata]
MEQACSSDCLPGTVSKGAKTHEYYHTSENLPTRFDNPAQTDTSGSRWYVEDRNRGNPVVTFTGPLDYKPYKAPSGSEWFQGYGGKNQHPMYRTSNSNYGARAPSVHTMPTQFHAKSQKFSMHLGKCGMYRNCSLNTEVDKSKV